MNYKPPASFAEMMEMFTPDKIAKMFDPQNLQSAFQPPAAMGTDFSSVIETNRKNYEAMVAANQEAMNAYKKFYEMQMQIFSEVMQSAQAHFAQPGAATDPEAARKQSELFTSAAEKGFALMAELAEASRKANEQAFAVIKTRVEEAVGEMQGK